jgi:hypothetical protein
LSERPAVSRREHASPFRRRDLIGPALCLVGAVCMLAGLSVDLGGTVSKALMLVAVVLFVPGAYVTLALVRRVAGPPN